MIRQPLNHWENGLQDASQQHVASIIKRHDVPSMGSHPIGLDYCRVEDVIAQVGSQLKVPLGHDYYE